MGFYEGLGTECHWNNGYYKQLWLHNDYISISIIKIAELKSLGLAKYENFNAHMNSGFLNNLQEGRKRQDVTSLSLIVLVGNTVEAEQPKTALLLNVA